MKLRGTLSLALLLAPLGCGDGQSPASGVTALLRAANAQYVPGELTTEAAADEPTVDNIRSNNNQVFPGAQGRSIGGSVDGKARAVLIGLEGDNAHWLVPAGVPDIETPGNLTFSSSLSYSPDLPKGKRQLRFRALDAQGQMGPAQALTLQVDETGAVGNLDIVLEWDTTADLDLHVRIPDATPGAAKPFFDISARFPLALPPKSGGYTQAEVNAAGKLLYDTNGQCVTSGLTEGRYQEIVSFPGTLPAGPYEIRVDTVSLCGEPTAHWHLFVRDKTTPAILEVFGQSLERDTVAKHDGASGTWAMTFTP